MWYAKRPLPGAAPSHDYEFDDSVAPANAPYPEQPEPAPRPRTPDRPPEKSPSQKAADLQALMAPARREEPVQAPQVAELEETVSRPPVACHLGIWESSEYLLIGQWSDDASEQLQDSLARNLLVALGQEGVTDRRMLHWPVFRNPQIPGNSADDFRGVFEGVLSDVQQGTVILLGVLADQADDHRKYCLKPVFSKGIVDFPHTLAELSTTPDYKRELWRRLKPSFPV
jgi:hypothetical protein